jgi:general stress protein 26
METDKREHLVSIFKDLDSTLLFTHSAADGLRGRPMAPAEIQDDGDIVFPTGLDSVKVAHIQADPRVAVGVQGKTKWAYVAGRAAVSRERAMIHRLWKDSWKLWFPQGKDDPNLCLLIVDVTEGEYWDNSGARGIRFAIEAARAYVGGRKPDAAKMDENAKVKL